MKHTLFCALLISTWLSFLTACEGGKSRPATTTDASCAAGENKTDGQCTDPGPALCSANQTRVDGRCKTDPICAPGSYLASDNTCVAGKLSLEVLSQSACYASDGATELVLQYIVRDEAGNAIDPEITQLNNQLLRDDQPIDIESILAQDSEALESDLVMSLVLDSSYSMLKHSPPAFRPMKLAAMDVLKNTQAAWNNTGSEFHWELTWFNSLIYRPVPNNAGEPWTIDDIEQIPAPEQGQYTALYKAVDDMTSVHADLYQKGIAAGPRDQHVMVVFSDGADNYGFFDNASIVNQNNLNGMLFWSEKGYTAVAEISDIVSAASVANLRIYVIGLGSGVNESELRAIANSGGGRYLFGSNTETLSTLFEQIQRELVTQQTFGAKIPLADGDYTFELRTERVNDAEQAGFSWTMKAGKSLPLCAPPGG